MNLRGIVAVSGRPGLFKLVGQNKAGYVLESLDAQKAKIVANVSNTKLASLEDITVYGQEDDLKLVDVLTNIAAAKGEVPDSKADVATLKAFFEEVAPKHDEEKVYTSDMKKIVSWYHLLKDMPLFSEEALPTSEEHEKLKAEEKNAAKVKAGTKPANAKAPSKAAQPAKKASMTSKKGV
jgi:flagellar hook-length control protein FliK